MNNKYSVQMLWRLTLGCWLLALDPQSHHVTAWAIASSDCSSSHHLAVHDNGMFAVHDKMPVPQLLLYAYNPVRTVVHAYLLVA